MTDLTFSLNYNNGADTPIYSLIIPDKISFNQAKNGAFVVADITQNNFLSSSIARDRSNFYSGNFSGGINPKTVKSPPRIVSYTLYYFHANRQNVIDATLELQSKLFANTINSNNCGQGHTIGGTLNDNLNVTFGTMQSLHMAKIEFDISYAVPYALNGFKNSTSLDYNETGLVCINSQSSSNATVDIRYSSSTKIVATCKLNLSALNALYGYVIFLDSGAYYTNRSFQSFMRVGGALSGSPIFMQNEMSYNYTVSGELRGTLGLMTTK